MNGRELFYAMSHIDEGFIEEAERWKPRGRAFSPWLRAACLCLVILGLCCIQPLLTAVPGPVPSTSPTDDPFLPEGFPTVVVQVEEMTDDGFIGIVTELYGAARPEAGTMLYVTITADTRYLTADGSLVPAQEAWQDHTGCCVAVEFLEYDEETASVTANILSVESEAMP